MLSQTSKLTFYNDDSLSVNLNFALNLLENGYIISRLTIDVLPPPTSNPTCIIYSLLNSCGYWILNKYYYYYYFR